MELGQATMLTNMWRRRHQYPLWHFGRDAPECDIKRGMVGTRGGEGDARFAFWKLRAGSAKSVKVGASCDMLRHGFGITTRIWVQARPKGTVDRGRLLGLWGLQHAVLSNGASAERFRRSHWGCRL